MESLGEKLKTARESKGLNFDQVSRETNIAGRYLEALEAEDFSGFPGEPYVTGFLRNYSEYLGLDAQEALSLYRSLKIQEQPVPVEQLLKSPSPLPRILIAVAVVLAVLGAAGGGVFFFINRPRKAAAPAPVVRPASEFAMTAESLEKRLYPGDSVLVSLGTTRYKIELSNLGEALTITTPAGAVGLDLSQKVTVDLNGDGIAELLITAADFVKNNSAAGALLRFEMNNTLAFDPPPPGSEDGAVSAEPGASDLSGAVVIFSSPSAYPFTLQAVFQGYCMFRWEILFERDRRDRNEQYFQRSDEFNIQAQNGVRIWVSNAQAVKLQVIGGGRTVPLELGGAGEVVVADVRWVRDDENRYRLVLARLETGNSR
ncbi:MAG: helix-turn-helix domain-containing protein [Treponema sp.]|nr:helix-turn-helix domain-containing protein [Treponema sp.]